MARLRPARTCRRVNSQAWARYSLRQPKKNYIRARPHTSLNVFKMGADNPDFDVQMTLEAQQDVQLRSNALEAARQNANKHLEKSIPEGYIFRVLVYPHNVVREHRMAVGAGADRISQGMAHSYGRPVSVAARIKKNQPIFLIKTRKENIPVAHKAFIRAISKLSGAYKIRTS
jgi:large subunit ribosomal protein L10e